MNETEIIPDVTSRVIAESVTDLANVNASAIAAALAEVEANKLTVSISIKFQLAGKKLVHAAKIGFACKHTDECEGIVDLEKEQLRLPGTDE